MGRVRRGDVVLAAAAGDYGKPRPWLILQADHYNDSERPRSVLVCTFTTHHEATPYRIPLDLRAGDSHRRSWVMVDKLTAIKRERLGAKIAITSPEHFDAVEDAMIDLLGIDKDK